jgi:hypothetical protein
VAETPQLVFLSFDEAVNIDNYPLYQDLFYNRKNPNNQSVTITVYASHDYTNYTMIHELWRRGHEIGLHSISTNSSQAYWQTLDEAGWRAELVDQREQMTRFARIPIQEIQGVRAPQLLVGGDPMYNVLEAAKFTYDCSRPTNAFRESGLWPYTNDYATIQDCQIPPCPEREHPGFWTVPMINLIGSEDRKEPCSMVDQCIPLPMTADETYNLLNNNFQRHYTNHRAPFGVFIRHGWINGTSGETDPSIQLRREGYVRFLDYLATLNDVYIVSVARGLEWVRNPVPLKDVPTYPAFQVTEQVSQCQQTYSCEYRAGQTPFKPPLAEERMFHSCATCPQYYPWVGNHLGRNPYS